MNNNYQIIKDQVDILQVVKDYGISVKKNGVSNYKGLCPFHNDKNPSLSVDTQRKIFKCFSCETTGSVIKFVELMEKKRNPNFTTQNAISLLAKKYNIQIDYNSSRQEQEKKYIINNKKLDQKAIDYSKLNDQLSNMYHYELLYNKNNVEALNYLLNRGVSIESIKYFKLGFSAINTVAKFADHDENTKALMLEGHLLTSYMQKDGTNKYNEFFSNRVMIPLADQNGNVIGYTGRSLQQNDATKYLNSKESNYFNKSAILFNYHNAKNYTKDTNKILVVEGNFDVVAATELGYKNVVGLNSCKLTKEQLQLLKELNAQVVVSLDNDRAGIEGTLKILDDLQRNHVDCVCCDISKYNENFKDFGDILAQKFHDKQNNIVNNQFDLSNVLVSKFEYELKHKHFSNKEITANEIEFTYKQLSAKGLTPLEKHQLTQYCYNESSLDNGVIDRILENEPSKQMDTMNSKLIEKLLKGFDLSKEQKAILEQEIVNNFDNYFVIENLSIQFNKELLQSFMEKQQMNCQNKEIQSAKERNNERVGALINQTKLRDSSLNCFNFTDYLKINELITRDNPIRTTSRNGLCKPEDTERFFNRICEILDKTKRQPQKQNEKIDFLVSLTFNLCKISVFENVFSPTEQYFLEQSAKELNIPLNLKKLITPTFYENISKSLLNNERSYLKTNFIEAMEHTEVDTKNFDK